MSIRIKRGLEANRKNFVPGIGEPLFTTDTKKLYIGDGQTFGGVEVDTTGGEVVVPVQSVAGKTGDVVLTKTDVGLPFADNTSDDNKPISSDQQAALDTKVDVVINKGLSTNDYTTAEKNKLAAVAAQATANATDAQLRDRSTHTGSQPISTVAGLQDVLNSKQAAGDYISDADLLAHTGNVNNPHSVTKAQLGLELVDNTSDINKPVSTAQQAALNAKASAAALTSHTADTANPHTVTKGQVGLGNVDNTSDSSKPISAAQQAALDEKLGKTEIIDGKSFSAQTADPAPIPDVLQLYNRELAGRGLLSVATPTGRTYQLQPGLFGNYVGLISANRTTTLLNLFLVHSTVGTVSHPVSITADLQVYGRMANFATLAATINGKAGTQSADALFYRGSVPSFGGWWSTMRVGTPNIAEIQIVAGVTNGTTTTVYAQTTSLHFAMFFYDTSLGHTTWHFWTKGGVTAGTIVDTGVPVVVGGVYDLMSRCQPNGSEIEWHVINVDTGAEASGSVSTTLPTSTVLMRAQILATTLEAAGAIRNVRFQRIYMESDR